MGGPPKKKIEPAGWRNTPSSTLKKEYSDNFLVRTEHEKTCWKMPPKMPFSYMITKLDSNKTKNVYKEKQISRENKTAYFTIFIWDPRLFPLKNVTVTIILTHLVTLWLTLSCFRVLHLGANHLRKKEQTLYFGKMLPKHKSI